MNSFVTNTRILGTYLTGVQRYLQDILEYFPETIRQQQVAPKYPLHGIRGHLWEQCRLPFFLNGRVLWSPSNTGPITVRKQVVTIHDVVPLDHPEWLNPRFAAWYRFLLPKLVHRVERVIVISEFTKTRLLEKTGVSEDRVVVVHNGVNSRFCPQSSEHIHIALRTLNIPSRHYVLSLGSLEPRKNLGRLLHAWSLIESKLPDDLWLVIGGAKGKNLVFQDVPEIRKLPPRVFLTGHVPDSLLPQLYAGATVFAYLSVYEGFGLPPLEAMASGTPTIVGNQGSLPEVVGDAAITVDPYGVEEIAVKMKQLIEDEEARNVLSNKSIERAERFSWKRSANQTLDVINSI
jgi:glycosyltransferase involved in cell wall biosynthesis